MLAGCCALIASGALAGSVAALAVLVRTGWMPLADFDLGTVSRLNEWIAHRPGQVWLWKAVSVVGGPSELRVGAALVALGCWRRHRRREAVLIGATMIGAAVLSGGVKLLVARVRPSDGVPVTSADGYAFPSGHALSSIVAAGLVLLLAWPALGRRRRAGTAAAVIGAVGAVGFSRLALGVHYPSDVLGGWLLGTAWLLAVRAGDRYATAARSGPSRGLAVAGHQPSV